MIRLRAIAVMVCLLSAFALNAATFTVTNTNDNGAGSLRQAILDANASAGTDRIEFAIGSGAQLIAPLTVLPKITDTVTIDATTQPGYASSPVISLDGSNIPGTYYDTVGFYLQAPNSSVIGFAITNFKLPNAGLSGEGAGVAIAATGCSVFKCYLGIQRNGRTPAGNDSGVRIDVGGGNIGGPGLGNVISGNNRGINHLGLETPLLSTTIRENIIGLGSDGRTDVPNVYGMLATSDIVLNNRIANQYDDIDMLGPNAVIAGNKIGIRSDGSVVPLRTVTAAVAIYDGLSHPPTNTRLGGPNPGDANEIAGATPGVYVSGGSNVQIAGNNIHNNNGGIIINSSPQSKINANTIHDNFTGVWIRSGGGNWIAGNSIYNEYTGIQIEPGANFDIAHPTITSAKPLNGGALVEGTYDGNASSAYKIEVFSSPSCAGDGQGPGKTFLGTVNVTTNSAGHATFSATFATSIIQGWIVAATATDSGNNTSEFSTCYSVQGAGSLAVSAAGTITEGGSSNVTITRSGGSVGSITVDYSTASGTASSGSDFVPKSGTLTFADGETQKSVNVSTIDDSIHEPSETFSFAISNPTGGAIISVASAQLTIDDNDPVPDASMDDVSAVKPSSGTATVSFLVRLNSASGLPATLNYATSNGTALAGVDYQATSGTITFNPGQTGKNIDVTLLSNNISTNRTFTLTLTAVSGVSPSSLSAQCTIFARNVSITPSSQSIAAGSKGKLTVLFGQPLAADATLTVTSSKPAAFSVPATVAAAAGATSVQFQVSALTAPASSRIEVTLPAAIGGDVLSANVSSYEQATLILPAEVSVIVGSTVSVNAALNPASDQPQTIALENIDPSIADVPASVTIPAGGNGTFVITGIRRGQATVRATLPIRYGAVTTMLLVNVLDVPVTPVILSVSPAAGPASGGTPVVATGIHLRGNCAVSFGGTAAPTTVLDDAHLTATTPAHAAGTVDVLLTCGSDSFVLPNGFTFLAGAPTLSSVAPAFGNIAGGTIVKLTGDQLSSACGVFFGGSPAHNVELDDAGLIATTPQHQAGTVDVTVKCGSESATRNAAFTYATSEEPAAAINSVDPLFGSVGQSVTLSGLRFRAGDRVMFGTTPAVILSTTNDTHVVRIPDVPLGRIAITLTDPNDHVTTTGPIFTIVEAITPKIVHVAPSAVLSGAELQIEGEGFRAGYTFTIGDRAATTLSMSFNQAVVRVPALDAGTYRTAVLNGSGNISAIGPNVIVGTGVAVTSVSATCGSTDGGGSIVIHGDGFAAGATVRFGDVVATDVVVVDPQTITATVPAAPEAGMADITVTNGNGDRGTLWNAFRYTSPYDPDGCGARRHPGGR